MFAILGNWREPVRRIHIKLTAQRITHHNRRLAAILARTPFIDNLGFDIQGGRDVLRKAIYLPAVVVTRFNPDMKMKYQELIANGKCGENARLTN